MEIACEEREDPVGQALALALEYAPGPTARRPFGPHEFWAVLEEKGFHFVEGRPLRKVTDPGRVEEWGSFFALLILNHAVSRKLIDGDAVARIYSMRMPGG